MEVNLDKITPFPICIWGCMSWPLSRPPTKSHRLLHLDSQEKLGGHVVTPAPPAKPGVPQAPDIILLIRLNFHHKNLFNRTIKPQCGPPEPVRREID